MVGLRPDSATPVSSNRANKGFETESVAKNAKSDSFGMLSPNGVAFWFVRELAGAWVRRRCVSKKQLLNDLLDGSRKLAGKFNELAMIEKPDI